MKANELRIGNLVNYGVNIVPIKSIHTESVFKDTVTIYVELNEKLQNYCLDINEIEPITLTDEWFEKWGFYKDGEFWSRGIWDCKYCFRYRDWAKNWAFYQEYTDSVNPKDDGIKYPISFDIEYVHQVQNIWFALLHEEIWEIEK